jgi:hypothetical protein
MTMRVSRKASSEWASSSSPRPKKASLSQSAVKVMMIFFTDMELFTHTQYQLKQLSLELTTIEFSQPSWTTSEMTGSC